MDSKELSRFVGDKIRYYRKRKKITQKELGDILGVKHNTVSDYERGIISPEQDTLFSLSDALDISINDLFPSKENTGNKLEQALNMSTKKMSAKDIEFLNRLIEKTLSMEEKERDKFLESIKFTVDYYDRMNLDRD